MRRSRQEFRQYPILDDGRNALCDAAANGHTEVRDGALHSSEMKAMQCVSETWSTYVVFLKG